MRPRLSPAEMERIQTRMNQLQDCVYLINTTTKPDVFFRRLHMALDVLLDLRSYESFNIFKGSRPSDDYNRILYNLDTTVNAFIDRALEANQQKINSLKTEKAKENNHNKFVTSLIAAFDCANTFWSGSFSQTRVIPHYTGPLFTANNYQRVQALFYSDCNRSRFCTKCGSKIDDGDNFCMQCGSKV